MSISVDLPKQGLVPRLAFVMAWAHSRRRPTPLLDPWEDKSTNKVVCLSLTEFHRRNDRAQLFVVGALRRER